MQTDNLLVPESSKDCANDATTVHRSNSTRNSITKLHEFAKRRATIQEEVHQLIDQQNERVEASVNSAVKEKVGVPMSELQVCAQAQVDDLKKKLESQLSSLSDRLTYTEDVSSRLQAQNKELAELQTKTREELHQLIDQQNEAVKASVNAAVKEKVGALMSELQVRAQAQVGDLEKACESRRSSLSDRLALADDASSCLQEAQNKETLSFLHCFHSTAETDQHVERLQHERDEHLEKMQQEREDLILCAHKRQESLQSQVQELQRSVADWEEWQAALTQECSLAVGQANSAMYEIDFEQDQFRQQMESMKHKELSDLELSVSYFECRIEDLVAENDTLKQRGETREEDLQGQVQTLQGCLDDWQAEQEAQNRAREKTLQSKVHSLQGFLDTWQADQEALVVESMLSGKQGMESIHEMMARRDQFLQNMEGMQQEQLSAVQSSLLTVEFQYEAVVERTAALVQEHEQSKFELTEEVKSLCHERDALQEAAKTQSESVRRQALNLQRRLWDWEEHQAEMVDESVAARNHAASMVTELECQRDQLLQQVDDLQQEHTLQSQLAFFKLQQQHSGAQEEECAAVQALGEASLLAKRTQDAIFELQLQSSGAQEEESAAAQAMNEARWLAKRTEDLLANSLGERQQHQTDDMRCFASLGRKTKAMHCFVSYSHATGSNSIGPDGSQLSLVAHEPSEDKEQIRDDPNGGQLLFDDNLQDPSAHGRLLSDDTWEELSSLQSHLYMQIGREEMLQASKGREVMLEDKVSRLQTDLSKTKQMESEALQHETVAKHALVQAEHRAERAISEMAQQEEGLAHEAVKSQREASETLRGIESQRDELLDTARCTQQELSELLNFVSALQTKYRELESEEALQQAVATSLLLDEKIEVEVLKEYAETQKSVLQEQAALLLDREHSKREAMQQLGNFQYDRENLEKAAQVQENLLHSQFQKLQRYLGNAQGQDVDVCMQERFEHLELCVAEMQSTYEEEQAKEGSAVQSELRMDIEFQRQTLDRVSWILREQECSGVATRRELESQKSTLNRQADLLHEQECSKAEVQEEFEKVRYSHRAREEQLHCEAQRILASCHADWAEQQATLEEQSRVAANGARKRIEEIECQKQCLAEELEAMKRLPMEELSNLQQRMSELEVKHCQLEAMKSLPMQELSDLQQSMSELEVKHCQLEAQASVTMEALVAEKLRNDRIQRRAATAGGSLEYQAGLICEEEEAKAAAVEQIWKLEDQGAAMLLTTQDREKFLISEVRNLQQHLKNSEAEVEAMDIYTSAFVKEKGSFRTSRNRAFDRGKLMRTNIELLGARLEALREDHDVASEALAQERTRAQAATGQVEALKNWEEQAAQQQAKLVESSASTVQRAMDTIASMECQREQLLKIVQRTMSDQNCKLESWLSSQDPGTERLERENQFKIQIQDLQACVSEYEQQQAILLFDSAKARTEAAESIFESELRGDKLTDQILGMQKIHEQQLLEVQSAFLELQAKNKAVEQQELLTEQDLAEQRSADAQRMVEELECLQRERDDMLHAAQAREEHLRMHAQSLQCCLLEFEEQQHTLEDENAAARKQAAETINHMATQQHQLLDKMHGMKEEQTLQLLEFQACSSEMREHDRIDVVQQLASFYREKGAVLSSVRKQEQRLQSQVRDLQHSLAASNTQEENVLSSVRKQEQSLQSQVSDLQHSLAASNAQEEKAAMKEEALAGTVMEEEETTRSARQNIMSLKHQEQKHAVHLNHAWQRSMSLEYERDAAMQNTEKMQQCLSELETSFIPAKAANISRDVHQQRNELKNLFDASENLLIDSPSYKVHDRPRKIESNSRVIPKSFQEADKVESIKAGAKDLQDDVQERRTALQKKLDLLKSRLKTLKETNDAVLAQDSVKAMSEGGRRSQIALEKLIEEQKLFHEALCAKHDVRSKPPVEGAHRDRDSILRSAKKCEQDLILQIDRIRANLGMLDTEPQLPTLHHSLCHYDASPASASRRCLSESGSVISKHSGGSPTYSMSDWSGATDHQRQQIEEYTPNSFPGSLVAQVPCSPSSSSSSPASSARQSRKCSARPASTHSVSQAASLQASGRVSPIRRSDSRRSVAAARSEASRLLLERERGWERSHSIPFRERYSRRQLRTPEKAPPLRSSKLAVLVQNMQDSPGEQHCSLSTLARSLAIMDGGVPAELQGSLTTAAGATSRKTEGPKQVMRKYE